MTPSPRRPRFPPWTGSIAFAAGLLVGALAGARADDGAPPAAPDFAFFQARVAPLLLARCASCHADPRRRTGRFRLRPAPGHEARGKDPRRNFEATLRFVVPGNPARSPLLLKALGPAQGGVPHEGGALVRLDGLEYGTLVDFIQGRRLEEPPAPPAGPPPSAPPGVGEDGLVLGAADAERRGDVALVEARPGADGADGVPARLVPGAGGGSARFRVEVRERAAWSIEIRFAAGVADATLRADGGDALPLGPLDPSTPQVVGPRLLVDGETPIDTRRGVVRPTPGGGLRFEGTSAAPAAVALPFGEAYDELDAEIAIDEEAEGGDDALLLFDASDLENGRLAGLVDGGRRAVLGRLERGVPHMLASARLDGPHAGTKVALRLRFSDGQVALSVEGKTGVTQAFDGPPVGGALGFLTHGRATLLSCSAAGQYELWHLGARLAPAVPLAPGVHVLEVVLPPGGPGLESLRIRRLRTPAPGR